MLCLSRRLVSCKALSASSSLGWSTTRSSRVSSCHLRSPSPRPLPTGPRLYADDAKSSVPLFSRPGFWDAMVPTYDASFYGVFARLFADALIDDANDAIKSALSSSSSSAISVLDVGAGSGCIAERLITRYPAPLEVTALDVSPAMIAALSARNLPRVRPVVGDAHALTSLLGSQRFSSVISGFTLQFASDRLLLLSEAVKTLTPNGSLVAAVWSGLEHCSLAQLFFSLLDEVLGVPAGSSSVNNPNFRLSDARGLHYDAECSGLQEVRVRLATLTCATWSDEQIAASLTAAAESTLKRKAIPLTVFNELSLKRIRELRARGHDLGMSALILTGRSPSAELAATSEALNAARTYFYLVDAQGRIWRQEWATNKNGGEVRQDHFRDEFFSRLRRNLDDPDAERARRFPFVTLRGRERYYVAAVRSPVVFWDLSADTNKLKFAASLEVDFDPSQLELLELPDGEAVLRYPINVPHVSTPSERTAHVEHKIDGVLERHLAYKLLDSCQDLNGSLALPWKGQLIPLKRSRESSDTPRGLDAAPDARYSERKSAWWLRTE